VVFRPGTDSEEQLVYAMAGCHPSNHQLLLEIATLALQFYHILVQNWRNEAEFSPPSPGILGRLWRR
jgi:hypothetical protein